MPVEPEVELEEKSEKKLIAVVRMRGSFGVKKNVRITLEQLHLTRKNHLVLLNNSVSLKGMLLKARDYITWGEADETTVALLKQKKGEQKVYRLNPPRKGFKGGIKRHYPKGALGYRGEKINELIKAML